jgi:amidohydrolase
MPLRDQIRDIRDDVVAIRHDLHAHPELGYEEQRTSGVVQRELAGYGVEFRSGIAGTGVLGFLPATTDPGSARTVALRADMDALPIEENTDLPYRSTHPGRMHACGHDGHTSILLATARTLSAQPERPNNVLFLFQPAEEGGAGGKRMVDEGALDGRFLGPKADVIFGLHGFPSANVGHISTRNGPLMAAAAEFSVLVTGQGSHAAYPHYGVDPIVAAAHIVTALQSIVSRNVSPLDSIVITIGIFRAGVAHNVIPDTAYLKGTMRTLNDETEALGQRRIQEVVQNTAAAFGAHAEVTWVANPYPVTFNDPAATDHVRQVAGRVIGTDKVHEEAHPSMGGEDFSFYGRKIPASFFFLGLLPDGHERYPNLHAPEFDFNDDALDTGIELMCELALSR